jgi:HlyD family secretion protein
MESKPPLESDVTKNLELDRSLGQDNRWKRWVFWVIPAIVVVAVAVAMIIGKKSDKTDAVQYRTQKAERGSLTVIVTATGTLQPTNKVDVGCELSGTIKSVEADYNSRVKVGQILARLDITKLDAQVKQSRAALEAAKGKVLQTQATVKETRSKLAQLQKVMALSNRKVPSQADLDAAEAAFERAMADDASARAAVSQAQATLDANETDLSKAVIRSPINGIVLTRSVEPGQTVAAAYQAPTLFTLAEDLTQMDLHVNVDEADIGKVLAGQKATFTVAAYPNRTFQARIAQARYGSTTTSGVVTYETVLKVDNTDLSLRPGMTATADITVKKVENAILIPNAALRFTPPIQEAKQPSSGLLGALLPHPPGSPSTQHKDAAVKGGQQRVWTLKNGQPSAISVTIGSTDGIVAEVSAGGVEAGTLLVIDIAEKGK